MIITGFKQRKTLLLAGAALMVIPGPARAGDETLDDGYIDDQEIIVTGEKDGYLAISSAGLKTETPLLDTPQIVSVITREQLDDQALQDIGDILRYTPGASIGQGEGHRDQITIRGQNTTASFFVDGLRDDAEYFRPLYNIERVEIHKGPNAMIFGRGGGGGIVNRVTKTPLAGQIFGSVTGSADSFSALYLNGDVNIAIGDNAAFRVNGLYEEFDNHRDFFEGRRFAINPTIATELGEKSRILFSYEYVNDNRVVDRGVPSFNNEPITGFRDTFFGIPGTNVTELQAHILKLRLEHDFSDNLQLNSTTIYANYNKFYQNIFAAGSDVNAGTVTLDGYFDRRDRENYITQGNLVWKGNSGGIGHTVLLGYEIGSQQGVNIRRDVDFRVGGVQTNTGRSDRITIPLAQVIGRPAHSFPVNSRDRLTDLNFVSLYIQNQISIGDMFDIIGGVRYDRFDIEVNDIVNNRILPRTDNRFSPRFGLIFKPKENISLYAGYSRSFLPRSGDQFLTLTPATVNLAPEVFENYEIGAKWDIRPNLSLTTALFRLDRDNQAVATDNDGNSAFQGSRTEGFEIQLVGQLLPGWQINAGYSYLDARESGRLDGGIFTNRRIGQVPQHMFSLWNRYEVNEQLGIGLGLTHQSSQFARTNSAVRLPSYTRVDAAFYYAVNEQFRVQLNVENLFDTTYFPAVHNSDNITTGAPINARLTATVSF